MILFGWMCFHIAETEAQNTAASPELPALDTNFFAHLNELWLTNQTALASNLYAGGTNLCGVAGFIGTNASSLPGTNSQAFSKSLNTIGRDLADFGTNLLTPRAPSLPYSVFLSGGAEFLNPYQIDASSHALKKTGDSTVAYLEFDYVSRFVIKNPSDSRPTPNEEGRFSGPPFLGGNLGSPHRQIPDIQYNLGFNFSNGTTNFSASTLAGSGDFYTQGAVGLPFWRSVGAFRKQQVSIEAVGGVVADKNFDTIHPNMFFGIGYQTSFRPHIGMSSSNTPGFFVSRAGAGWTDIPVISSTSGGTNFVAFDNNNFPKYEWNAHCSVQAFLAYPLTDSMFLTVEANVYLIPNPPDSWNVKVGASIPLEKIATTFASIVNLWK